jgi:DnaJ-class molecular chaperone
MDFYQVLNISPSATESEIKKAHRSLSFQYHPDKNPDPSASEKMKSINEAYETLGDSQRKKQYDNRNNPMNMDSILNQIFRQESRQGQGHGSRQNHNPHNMFEEIFKMHNMGGMNMNMGGINIGEPIVFTSFDNIQNSHSPEPIVPLDKKIEISFEQSFSGCNIPINIEREFRRGNTMFKEQEKIYVLIPAGIDDGEIIEINEKGNIMFDKRGTLRLHVKIGQHEKFERRGVNLVYKQTITFKESICGFEYLIHFIDGSPLKLKSSKGNIIQNGDEKTVKGKGFNRDGQVGDLIIYFKVTPQELTEEQVALFEKEL